jgi:putative hydrolase of the HAD superfamily
MSQIFIDHHHKKNVDQQKYLNFRSELSVDAVLFDLFDTLVLIDGDDPYIQSLQKMHTYLCGNGLNCSFNKFKDTYLQVLKKITIETSSTLEEPHFTRYVEQILTDLGVKLKSPTYLTMQAAEEFSNEFARHIILDPHAHEVLEYISGKFRVGLISNLAFSECAWSILENFDLKKYLDPIVISGDINLRKPHPQIFNLSLRYLGVHPSRAMFVGDTLETDVVGSKNARLFSVQILRKQPINSIIKPDYSITDLKQLMPLLDYPVLQFNPIQGMYQH